MSNYIQGLNVNQMSFMPFSLDEIIDGDNPVRGINAVVDALDKDSLKFNHSGTKRTGRPPYDPIVMFKIYLEDKKNRKEFYSYIPIHHIVPLNEIGEEYIIDYKKDLVPVCPNCHAMLHRSIDGKKYTWQELKEKLTSKTVL